MAGNAPQDPAPQGTPPTTGEATAGRHRQKVPGSSRLGGLWVMLASGAVVLVLLLVFILQNDQHVQIHLYGAHFNAPVGVALLMAAALGVLLVVVPGAGRIIQLRRKARSLHRDRERLRNQLPQAAQLQQPQQQYGTAERRDPPDR